jgi:hypothetical protein
MKIWLCPPFSVQGASGYQRGSDRCDSSAGTSRTGNRLSQQPWASGVAAIATAATAADRTARRARFLFDSIGR